MLRSDESPFRNSEKAYELVIIGFAWWPEQWENLNGGLAVSARGSVLVAPPLTERTSIEEPWRDFKTPVFNRYWKAVDIVHDRIRAIGIDPTTELDPPDFGPGVKTRLDQAAMLHVEAAARAYLIENPHHNSWMQ